MKSRTQNNNKSIKQVFNTKIKTSIIFILLFLMMNNAHNQIVNILPLPVSVKMNKGVFVLDCRTKIIPTKYTYLTRYLQSQISMLNSLNLNIGDEDDIVKTNLIKLTVDTTLKMGDEEYKLVVSPSSCEIKAKTQNGLFYGIQSFLQLLPVHPVTQCEISCIEISDFPRFKWRGMHLDVSRHFFPKEFIFKYIDLLAMHKMNVFHWHLVDDQGWRIEIKKYPRLTEIGAWREDETGKPWNNFVVTTNDPSKKLYGGYYKQSDIREIVKYAEERQITIVPEIEIPGHCSAMIEAYPELSCSGRPWRNTPGVWEFSDPLCLGNEYTYNFVKDVLSEVIDLFQGKYIHMGGDECKRTTWEHCPRCQAKMKSENMTQVDQLQSYLMKNIEKYLILKGRQLIGWDEIIEGGLAPEATVMSWRGMDGGFEAARQGHNVVMTPSSHCYFDYSQISERDIVTGYTPLEKVYAFDPIPQGLTPDEAKHILGGQGNVWTENINTTKRVEEMILPRMIALSEVLWTNKKQLNYSSFLQRLNNFYAVLEKRNFNFFVPVPKGMLENNLFDKEIQLKLSTAGNVGQIYYTTDGTEPDLKSKIYTKPIIINRNQIIKACTYLPGGHRSEVVSGNFQQVDKFIDGQKTINLKKGIRYTYYEGKINNTDSIYNLKEIRKGVLQKFSFPDSSRDIHFAVEYEGYIHIVQSGIYTFYSLSDDGSVLYIANKKVVDNDGGHAEQERYGQIALRAGYHKIRLIYFQDTGGKSLKVSMKAPDMEKTEIVNEIFHTRI